MIDIQTTSTTVDNSECDQCHTKTPSEELTTLVKLVKKDWSRTFYYTRDYNHVPAVDLCEICYNYLTEGRRKK